MGGINSLSGLNKVSVDYRPQIDPNVPTANNAPQPQQDVEIIEVDAPAKANAKSVVKQLDALLMNAATKSVSANAATKVKTVGETLVDLDVITIEDAEKLESLAKNANEKLRALDNFSGRELAKSLMTKSGELVWRKGFFGGMSAVTTAVKAAIEAQEALSEALAKFNEDLAKNDDVDAAMQDSFTELQFQCDRRATEIYSVVVRMHDLAQQDVVNGIIDDEQVTAYLDATFKELMPREAIMMHGTVEALETMKAKFADHMRPFADKLDAFATDPTRTLSVQEAAELDAAMADMKNTLENVRKNGVEIRHPRQGQQDNVIRLIGENDEDENFTVTHTEVDKTLLDEMEKILADVHEQIDGVKEKSIERSRTAFMREVRNTFDLCSSPKNKSIMNGNGKNIPMLKQYNDAAKEMFDLFEQFKTGARPMEEFDAALDTCKSHFPDKDALYGKMKQAGFDDATKAGIYKGLYSLHILVAQFKELMLTGENMKANNDDSMLRADVVRKIMLGEAKLSVYVEAESRGFQPDDVDTKTDSANIASSKVLGSGTAGTTYLLTTHSGEELVFKPELDSRLGLYGMALGKGGAYLDSQKTANLNLATQQTAKAFGCEDIVVKYSVGVHDGQFGCFMEKAKGSTGENFYDEAQDENGGIAPANLKTAIKNPVERTNIQGKIAQKLNKLMWLDIIIGQGDRHWGNYFVNIDKTTHEVTLKAIDNDATFSAIRIGAQKYVIAADKTEEFKNKLRSVCETLNKQGNAWWSEYDKCLKNDPGFTENADKTFTIDLSKTKYPELAMATLKLIGMKSITMPEEIDKGFYDKLMEMDSNPAKKEEYLQSIAPRISPEALKAAEMRLNDAIEHAKKLAAQDKVYGDDKWKDPSILGQMTKIKDTVTIEKADSSTKMFIVSQGGVLQEYVETNTPSLYTRDYFHLMFN